jgi:hypothetical protein
MAYYTEVAAEGGGWWRITREAHADYERHTIDMRDAREMQEETKAPTVNKSISKRYLKHRPQKEARRATQNIA